MDLIDRVLSDAVEGLGLTHPIKITRQDRLISQDKALNDSGVIAAQHAVEFDDGGRGRWLHDDPNGCDNRPWRHHIRLRNGLPDRILVSSLLHELCHAAQTERFGPLRSRQIYTFLDAAVGYDRNPMEREACKYAKEHKGKYVTPFDYLKEDLAYAA
jgi:hypothetical protein